MIHFALIGKWGIGWSALGLAFCVISSLIVDFHAMTGNYCGAPNVLPSLSSAIGQLTPQMYIWRIITCFVTGLRLIAGMCYYNWYLSIPMDRYYWLYKGVVTLMVYCYSIEIAGLLGLSAISIEDRAQAHEQFFKTYLAHGQMYMLLQMVVIFWTHRSGAFIPKQLDRRLLVFRVFLYVTNTYCTKLAWDYFNYFFTHCDGYGYTKFATCEYLAITTNILNHSLAIIELHRYSFAVVPTKEITTGRFKNEEGHSISKPLGV